MPAVSVKKCISARVRRCRRVLAEQGTDALIVVNPVDVRYLTGFTGDDSVLVLTAKHRILVTDSRYTLQIKAECPGLSQVQRNGSMTEAVAATLRNCFRTRRRVAAVAIESEQVTLSDFKSYRRAIGKGLKECPGILTDLRQCKDTQELVEIGKAVRVAQKGLQAALQEIRIGMKEVELVSLLEYEMARQGGRPPAFNTIVAFGAHGAHPHAVAGNQRLKQNQPVLIDWGATVNGYKSDLTRCFCSGRIPPDFAEAYQRVLEAQLSAIEEVKPGIPLSQVDAAARGVMQKSGLPVYGHGTGHGIGLDIHEEPRLHPKNKQLLEEGMVITIEPAVYLPGKWGIRIEDDVLVTAKGRRVLSTQAKRLTDIALTI